MSDILDVFDDEAFDVVTLSDEVSRMPHQPMRIGQLGIFETRGIRTTDLGIQERNGTLALIAYTERDAPDNVMNGGRARVVKVETAHFPLKRTINPSSIQNARSLDISSGNVQLVAAREVVREKAEEMIPFHDVTLEYQRLGAIKGYLVDSDGTTIVHDLYDLMKVDPTTFYFDLSNNATKVRIKCLQATALIEKALGGTMYTGIRALCGESFFNKLISHPDVEKAYERWSEGAMLRNDPRFSGFEFGGIFFEVYRGSVGGVDFIADEECQIFPVGVPGMFITRFAPANMMEFVNTVGLPRYASIERLKHGRGVELLTESNPISVNTRPNASIKGSSAASP